MHKDPRIPYAVFLVLQPVYWCRLGARRRREEKWDWMDFRAYGE